MFIRQKRGSTKSIMYLVAIVIGMLYTAGVIMPVMGRMIDPNKLDARYIKEDMATLLQSIATIKEDLVTEGYIGINDQISYELDRKEITIRAPKITEKLLLPPNIEGKISSSKEFNLTKKGSTIVLGDKATTTCANINIQGKIRIEASGGTDSFADRAKVILKSRLTQADEDIYIKYVSKQDTAIYIDGEIVDMEALSCNAGQITGILTVKKERNPSCSSAKTCIVVETDDATIAQGVARLFI